MDPLALNSTQAPGFLRALNKKTTLKSGLVFLGGPGRNQSGSRHPILD
jgi:hypothetical protein